MRARASGCGVSCSVSAKRHAEETQLGGKSRCPPQQRPTNNSIHALANPKVTNTPAISPQASQPANMVLFDEDPVTLISETTNQFHIAPDKESLTRISTSLSHLQSARQSRLNDHHALLKSLSRRLNNLQSQIGFEEERHDAGKHASDMLRMDTEKFRIAKGVSDAEIEVERLGSELAGLRGQLDVLEREGVEGGRGRESGAEDEVVYVLLAIAKVDAGLLTGLQTQVAILPILGDRRVAGCHDWRLQPSSHPECGERRCQRHQC